MEEKKELNELSVTIHDTVADEYSGKKTKSIHLQEEGRVYKTFFTKKFAERVPYKAPNKLHVVSHIPGSVVEVCVAENQRVKKGEKLMVYEAMKMKNIVEAPFDGEIKEICAKVGDHLPKGACLVVFKKERAGKAE